MRKGIIIGIAAIGLVYGVLAWVKLHGFLDFFALAFVALSLFMVGWLALDVVRGSYGG